MGPLLVFLLSWYQLQAITQSALVGYTGLNALNNNNNNDNNMNDGIIDDLDALLPPPEVDDALPGGDEVPFVRTNYDQTEVEFRHPISSVNIDYARNSIVLKFRKETQQQRAIRQQLLKEAEEQRRALDKNFMRFGRSSQDFMRFGKRQVEQLPLEESASDYGGRAGRGYQQNAGLRDSRGDNFMRFGRASSDFMRFGRDPGRDYMRFGRTPSQDFMRFGRARSDNFMRLGRSSSSNNSPNDGNSNFMRFGRTPPERDQSENFMRLGKLDENFMRFGKSNGVLAKEKNRTKETQQQKHDLRETAKLLHQTQKNADDNPMDKAIQVLFSKQQHQQKQQTHMQPSSHSSEETTDNASNVEQDLDLSDYAFN